MNEYSYNQFLFFLPGAQAYWFCIGIDGKFGNGNTTANYETTDPDRSQCVHEWINDVDEKVSIKFCSHLA